MTVLGTLAVLMLAGLAFTVTSPLNMALVLLSLMGASLKLAREHFRGADVNFASVLGWNSFETGFHTVSAWCGSRAHGACRFCRFVRLLLEWRWPGHCIDQAVAEELQPMEGADGHV